ncbi:Formin-like protein 9 [Cardamine amara subsp. amara]|uniref:Formin-like protein n=1 Tax=Cardamine amara subsp. amara TaxID=228776 RepID=A0ABD0ZV00_CARAN
MQNFWFAIFFLLLTYAPSSLSYASAVKLSRRHLYDDGDPSLPPPLTPTSPPFFPLDSFTPPQPTPPPPFFTAFPTFPANISALVLPRSSKPHSTSPTLLVPALSAVLSVATAIGLALFLYGRYRGQNRHFKDTHSRTNTSSSKSYEDDDDVQSHITTNFNMAATTSPSEVFYIRSEESDHIRTGETCFLKSESPEIRPLPPLPSRSFQPNYEAEEEEEDEDEEEEEFYSPLASLTGSLNSSPSHSCTSSCSGWVSPARSFSITMSPPNPRYSETCNLQSPSPERLRVRKNNNGNGSSSLRMFSFWNQNIGFKFPRISSASTSPDRGTIRTPLSSLHSSVSTSPDGLFRKFLDSSPPIWNDFSRNVKSVLLSSASSRRDFVINFGESSCQQSQVRAAPALLPPPTRPPPLVPPSQPFVAPTKQSFSELPPKQLQWERLRSSSLKLNKEMVETMFIANSCNPNMIQRGLSYELPIQNQESKVLDPRKAQNIATLLQLLKLTTKDVCQALLDGDCDALGVELLECLLRLAPNEEEERKLNRYSDDSVIIKLGPAERFLKELLHVPFVFKRVEAMLAVANFHSAIKHLRRSFSTVQAACDELRNSRMFSVLVEAILKTGSKMNVITNRCGDTDAFKLDMLLKLVVVKGLDGSSLLQFVVQELVKSEGSILEGIRNLNSELSNVKKSADIEYDVLRSDVLKLCQRIKMIEELLQLSQESGSCGDQWLKFRERMARFLKTAAEEIVKIKIRECSTLSALEEVTEQFHGDASNEGHTLRIFMIVRDFLSVLDKVFNEMGM